MAEIREVTREWWARAVIDCELVTSAAVETELSGSPGVYRDLRLQLIKDLQPVPRTPEVDATARELIRHKVMPAEPSLDAHHLSAASHSACELLVTWDLQHLANRNKFPHIRRVLGRLGLPVPIILTPREHLRRMG